VSILDSQAPIREELLSGEQLEERAEQIARQPILLKTCGGSPSRS
jgi:hypothetical protein